MSKVTLLNAIPNLQIRSLNLDATIPEKEFSVQKV